MNKYKSYKADQVLDLMELTISILISGVDEFLMEKKKWEHEKTGTRTLWVAPVVKLGPVKECQASNKEVGKNEDNAIILETEERRFKNEDYKWDLVAVNSDSHPLL